MTDHRHTWQALASGRSRCVTCGIEIPLTKVQMVGTLGSLPEVEAYRAEVHHTGREYEPGEAAALAAQERILSRTR